MISDWPGFNVPRYSLSPSPKLISTFVYGFVPVFSKETRAIINKLCFSLVGSTFNEYSPWDIPDGVRNNTRITAATPAPIAPNIGILLPIKKQQFTMIIDFTYSNLIIEPRILFCHERSILLMDLIFSLVSISITFERYELVRLNDVLWQEQLHFFPSQQYFAHEVHRNFIAFYYKIGI